MIEKIDNILALFDYYELRARIIPAFIVFSPLFLSTIAVTFFVSASISWTAGTGGVVTLVVIYALSFIVRAMGRRTEASLWAGWNGPPSTRFMRWSDDFFTTQAKKAYHDAVNAELGIQLKDKEGEQDDLIEADRLITDAFREVRNIVKIANGKGLWNAHNAEYGFLRNIIGSLLLWLVLALLGTALCGFIYYEKQYALTLACLVGNGLVATLALASYLLRSWLINLTKQIADRYAESTWGSFLAIYRQRKN